MDELFATYARLLPQMTALGRRALPGRRRRGQPSGARARGQSQGARPRARPAAGRLAVAHGPVRQRPGGRGADPAPARPPAAGGAPLRRAAADGGQSGAAELRRARRAARPRRRSGSTTCASAAPPRRGSRGGSGSTTPARAPPNATPARPSVSRHVDGDEQQLLLSALLFEAADASEERIRARVALLSHDERAQAIAELCGPRANRRHRPGRGFEALRYRFEIVSDYGAFRDLQRHRMLTVQWQTLTPHLGAAVPRGDRGGRPRRRLPPRARQLARRLAAPRRRRPRRAGAVRALPRPPDPLRARPQRARGDARRRAALRPRGPSRLPRGRAAAAPPDRARSTRRSAPRCASSTTARSRGWSGSRRASCAERARGLAGARARRRPHPHRQPAGDRQHRDARPSSPARGSRPRPRRRSSRRPGSR